MALGMELGLGPGHIMLDGDLALIPKRGQSPQIFGPLLLWPNGCIRIPFGTEVGPILRHIVLDGDYSATAQLGCPVSFCDVRVGPYCELLITGTKLTHIENKWSN